MFCKNCGYEIGEGTAFCPNCGQPNAGIENILANAPVAPDYTPEEWRTPDTRSEQPEPAQPEYGAYPAYTQPAYQQPYYPEQPAVSPVSALVWGIIGLSFSCTFWFSLLGLIFSIIGRKKANLYRYTYGDISTMARVGGRLAKAGIIVGIILSVIAAIYFAVIIFAITMADIL